MPTMSVSQERYSGVRLLRAAGVTVVGAVIAVLVIRAIAVNVVAVPHIFKPLQVSSVLPLTIIAVLFAAGTCQLLNRFSAEPVRTFRRVAPIVLVLSFIPDIGIWASHAYQHSATASTVIPLMLMHIAVATLCLTVLPTLGTEAAVGRVGLAT